jgi:hypothetical protein
MSKGVAVVAGPVTAAGFESAGGVSGESTTGFAGGSPPPGGCATAEVAMTDVAMSNNPAGASQHSIRAQRETIRVMRFAEHIDCNHNPPMTTAEVQPVVQHGKSLVAIDARNSAFD